MNKIYQTATAALDGLLKDGQTIMAGGFGICGLPDELIEAVRDSGVTNLTTISNNAGIDGVGLSILLTTRQISKMIISYVGESAVCADQFMKGEVEIDFTPQGTLAERCRAGGAGIPAFYTRTGVGTRVAEGKEERVINGETFLLETGLVADLALVHAWKADTEGNLVFRKSARNFNPVMAAASRVTVAQVEQLVPAGELDPDQIHTPGIYVQRIVHVPDHKKLVEKRTTRPRIAA